MNSTLAEILAILNALIAVAKQVPGAPAEVATLVGLGEQVFLSAEQAFKNSQAKVNPAQLQPIAPVS